jgi:hypothetical protein
MKTEYRDAVSFVIYTSLLPKLVECWANSLRCQIRTDLYECGGSEKCVAIILKYLAMCLTFRNHASYTVTPLPSKHPILYIISTNIRTEFFKHAA